MADIPDRVLSRLARRRIALDLVGTPIHIPNARHLDSLRSQTEGDSEVIYEIETRERISQHSPDTALEVVEKLAEYRRKEAASNSAKGIRGRRELQRRVEEEIDGTYPETLEQYKDELRDSPTILAVLEYAW